MELTDCFEFRVTITQQFWVAKYASTNTVTISFSTKHVAYVPDVDVQLLAHNGSYNFFILDLTNRVHFAVRLLGNRLQLKMRQEQKRGTRGAAEGVTDVITKN